MSASNTCSKFIAILSSVFCLLSPALAAGPDDLQFAAALFNDGEYRQALDEFKRLQSELAGGEWEDDILFWMAECHFNLKEYAAADDLYKKLISQHPNFPRLEDAYAKLMGAYYSIGRFDDVLGLAETFSKKYPSSALNEQVYLLWIQSALRLKKYAPAEQLLETFQKIAPGSPYVWSLKSLFGNFLLKDQRHDRALPYFEEVYSYQKDPLLLLWIGECRFQTSNWSGARDAFAAFLQEQPQNDLARFKLALCEYRLGNFEQAISALQPFVERENENKEDALYFIAQSKMKLGKGDDAKTDLRKILSMRPNEELYKRAVAQLMQLEADEKDPSKIVDIYEKFGQAASVGEVQQYRAYLAYQKQQWGTVVSLLPSPKDRREMLMVAESHYALGDYPAASVAYSQLLSASAAPAEKRSAHVGLGWSAYAQEQYEPALKWFEAYVASDPQAPSDVHLAMAQSALSLGQTDRAVGYYDRARKVTDASRPDQKRISKNLGVLYYNAREYQKAIEALAGADEDDQVLSIVARCHVYLKQPKKAQNYLRRLKRPERYHLEIGAVYYELGQLEEAKTYFEKASQTPGLAVNIDEYLGIIAYNQGNYPDAAARLRKAQLKDPDNIEIRYELAAGLVRIEDAPRLELEEILRSLINNPNAPKSYRDNARMWLIRRTSPADTRAAMEEIKSIENTAERALALEHRGMHLFAQQAYDQAILLFEQLLATPGVSPEGRMQGLYGMGWSLYKIGKKDKAFETFRTLLAEFPKSSYASEVVLLLVEDAYGAGRYADAADLALKNMSRMTKNVDRLRFLAAESLYETKRYTEALTYYKAYLPDADRLSDYVRSRAGLASYHLKQYERANDYFSAITDSSLLEQRYYYQGMALYELGRKKQAADLFEKLVEMSSGDFQEEAWTNLVYLIEELNLWRKAIALGTRLSESPVESHRLIYGKALFNTESSLTARYCEKLFYIAKDPEVAAEAGFYAIRAGLKTRDAAKAKQLFDKLAAKYPKSRFIDLARKSLENPQ